VPFEENEEGRMRIKLLDPIEGYEDEAEFRQVRSGEHFIVYASGVPAITEWKFQRKSDGVAIVITPKKQWRSATVQDVVNVVSGLEVKARFRDDASHEWNESRLIGVESVEGVTRFASNSRTFWRYCEVLR